MCFIPQFKTRVLKTKLKGENMNDTEMQGEKKDILLVCDLEF